MKAIVLVVSLAVALVPVSLHAQARSARPHSSSNVELKRVVDRFYPDWLEPQEPEDRDSCHAVLTQDRRGFPTTIAAAYTDRFSAAVRILTRTRDGRYVVGAEAPEGLDLSGSYCELKRLDVNRDGSPELWLELSASRGSQAWVFSWDGAPLTNMTPTEERDGLLQSRLYSASPVDLDHDGIFEVVSLGDGTQNEPGEPALLPYTVFQLRGGGYAEAGHVVSIDWFFPATEKWVGDRQFRTIVDSVGPYTVRLINGDHDGAHRVTGGSIRLNGVEIFSAAQVNNGVEFASVVLEALSIDNEINAMLTGPPDAKLILTVEDSTRR